MRFLKRIVLTIFTPSRSIISRKEYNLISKNIKSPQKVLNVGSGNESILGYKFWNYIRGDYSLINLDICPGENVDIVSVLHRA